MYLLNKILPHLISLKLLSQKKQENPVLPSSNLGQCLRDLFMTVEDLYASGSGISIGEPDRFFDLVEENMDTMPVSLGLQ